MSLARQTLPAGLRSILVGSIAVHGALIAAMVGVNLVQPRFHKTPENVLTTKLVRLGKERPKDWLPRKVEPLPAAAETPVIKPGVETSTENQAKAPSAQERIKELSKVSSALDRLKKNSEEVEGRADGSVDGEVTDASLAIIGNKYADEIYRCLKTNYNLEGMDAAALKNKKATVVIRIRHDGTFGQSKIETKSGSSRFDDAVLRAVHRCGKVSAPPRELTERVGEDGIEVEFSL